MDEPSEETKRNSNTYVIEDKESSYIKKVNPPPTHKKLPFKLFFNLLDNFHIFVNDHQLLCYTPESVNRPVGPFMYLFGPQIVRP
jgi:hypothetical protein